MIITNTTGTLEYLTAEDIAVPHCFTTRFGGISTGIFNGLLSGAGYVAPEIVEGVTVAAVQSQAVKGVITFGFVGLETFTCLLLAILLLFLNVEKDTGRKQAEIAARREK